MRGSAGHVGQSAELYFFDGVVEVMQEQQQQQQQQLNRQTEGRRCRRDEEKRTPLMFEDSI